MEPSVFRKKRRWKGGTGFLWLHTGVCLLFFVFSFFVWRVGVCVG